MKRLLRNPFLFLLLSSIGLKAQDSASTVVQWTFSAAKDPSGYLVLDVRAHIAPGWRLYSTTLPDSLPNSRVLLDSSTGLRIDTIEEMGNVRVLRDKLFDNAPLRSFEGQAEWKVHLNAGPKKDVKGVVQFMAIYRDSVIGPESVSFRLVQDMEGQWSSSHLAEGGSLVPAQQLRRSAIELDHPARTCGGTGVENGATHSLWNIFVLGILGGLIALLTPCVFPMIPLTVSFFTKHTANRRTGIFRAGLYGFFIFLIYTLLSLPFYFIDSLNPEILNTISTNVWLNLFFFVTFIVFALSFFGLFELTLPASLASSVDSRARLGSWLGIFFMALTLALVSFSCTGPILGSLLAGSLTANGGALQLTVGMMGFGLALALPFALFALFPGWLHALPKSGGWLHSVKIVLGFLELGLAVKFLSNADLVEHWGILKREVFIGIWVLVSLCITLYLLGLLRFGGEVRPKKWSPLRLSLAGLFLAFALYLMPGLFESRYANRSLVSGFPPPLSYSIYGKRLVDLCGVEAKVKNDYQGALQMARDQHKPLLIDFTGWACVNCRKMEENVWTDPQVKALIADKFILVSLYVDDRKSLADDDQFIYKTKEGHSKTIRTIGDQYATLQTENFSNASQPLYVVLSPEEKLLSYPVGYTPNAREYESWLRCGLEASNESLR